MQQTVNLTLLCACRVARQAADEECSLHREAMSFALGNAQSQLELVRPVYHNAWKYYQIAVELLMERQELNNQLQAADRLAAATRVKAQGQDGADRGDVPHRHRSGLVGEA